MDQSLYWRPLWQSLGWLGLGLLVLVSLMPVPDDLPGPLGWDKVQHGLAYALLMIWFWQAFPRSWRWPVLLFAIGCVIELLQASTSYRFAEWPDIIANTLGLGLGALLVVYTPLGRSLLNFEQLLRRLFSTAA